MANSKGHLPHILQSYTLNKAFFFYAVKKAERLSRAVYLVTNFFSDTEPVKWKLRAGTLILLEEFSRFTSSSLATSSDISHIRTLISSVVAHLGVAHTAGLVSEMNFSIIRNEYQELSQIFEAEIAGDAAPDTLRFPDTFFDVEKDEDEGETYLYAGGFDELDAPAKTTKSFSTASSKAGEENKKENPKDTLKDNKEIKRTFLKDNKNLKDTLKDKSEEAAESAARKESSLGVGMPKDTRREIIIQFIKNEKEVSVKDTSRAVPDVSEKTVQRELAALVDEGVLERVGKRRWSRYRLAR